MTRVGVVVVSHSARLAAGVVELAAQMAPDVSLVPVGGDRDGGLGTNVDAISDALRSADQGRGVVVLYDVGSARMAAELAVELSHDSARVVDAPLVEGAVAAAVAAQGGADLAAVAKAATGEPSSGTRGGEELRIDVVLTNDVGLHARPAALLARRVAELDAEVTVWLRDQRADARSVLDLMALDARHGDRLTVLACGPQAREALRRIEELVASRFEG